MRHDEAHKHNSNAAQFRLTLASVFKFPTESYELIMRVNH